MLTLDDLGVLRGVEVDGDAVTVDDHPDLLRLPRASRPCATTCAPPSPRPGYARVEVRTVLSPPWSTDWISDEGRRKLAEHGIAPPGRAGPRERRARSR